MLQRPLPEIPENLQPFAAQYNATKGRRRELKDVSYQELLGKALDLELSLQDIGDALGVTRECIRQTIDKYLPGVRPPEIRRTKTGRNCDENRRRRAKKLAKKRRAKRAEAERAFRENNRVYRLLKIHCENAGLTLSVTKDQTKTWVRHYRVADAPTYVRFIGSASRVAAGRRYYAKAQEIDRQRLKRYARFVVIVHITKPKPTYAMYMMGMQAYLKTGLECILIPLTKRHPGNRLESAVDWTKKCKSSFARNPDV